MQAKALLDGLRQLLQPVESRALCARCLQRYPPDEKHVCPMLTEEGQDMAALFRPDPTKRARSYAVR